MAALLNDWEEVNVDGLHTEVKRITSPEVKRVTSPIVDKNTTPIGPTVDITPEFSVKNTYVYADGSSKTIEDVLTKDGFITKTSESPAKSVSKVSGCCDCKETCLAGRCTCINCYSGCQCRVDKTRTSLQPGDKTTVTSAVQKNDTNKTKVEPTWELREPRFHDMDRQSYGEMQALTGIERLQYISAYYDAMSAQLQFQERQKRQEQQEQYDKAINDMVVRSRSSKPFPYWDHDFYRDDCGVKTIYYKGERYLTLNGQPLLRY